MNIMEDVLKEEKRLPELQTGTANVSLQYGNVYIDESGYKSKSKNLSGNCEKKISVFVGVVVPTNKEEEISSFFKPLFDELKKSIPADMKLHITDVFNYDKDLASKIRDGYLEIFKRERGTVLFGAKRARIEEKTFNTTKKLSSDSAARINPNLRINIPYSKETLEGKAFESLYGKMEAFAEDYNFNLTPLIDEISEDKENEYLSLINEFRNINYSEEKITLTAWDKIKKQVVESSGKITFSTNLSIENRVNDIKVVGKDNPLILLADILANYIHHYMLSLSESEPLHAPSSYIDFDLYNNIYGLIDGWMDDYM
ncbi:hypothetical protein R83H12_01746 [Fibrobacteria bacterium R8-3-H12]